MPSFFNKNQRKSCAFCKYGVASEYTEDIFCKKRGIVCSFDVCRKYKYDVLKRTPEVVELKKDYSANDFSL